MPTHQSKDCRTCKNHHVGIVGVPCGTCHHRYSASYNDHAHYGPQINDNWTPANSPCNEPANSPCNEATK